MTFALRLTMTTRGLQRFSDAQLGGDIDLRITEVGFTDAGFITAPTLTALPGEFRRIATLSGAVVGDNVVHMIVRDDEAVRYQARGFGLFLADGTLFAVYGQGDRIVEKAAAATLLFAIDIVFPTSEIAAITFGDANFLNPPATTERAGVVRLATPAEADAGVATLVVAPVSVLKAMLVAIEARLTQALTDFETMIGDALDGLAARTTYGSGLVKGGGRNDENRTLTVDAATGDQVRAGTALDLAVTPAALAGAGAVYVVQQAIQANGGYRVWSDGLKECWGSVNVPANASVSVALPVPHTEFCVPVGTSSINQDEASIGALNASAAGFDVRNKNPMPTTFYWHTKGH
jgi:hypothetical protein